MFAGLREYFERMAPRERRLVGILGVVLLVAVFAVIGLQIKRGLMNLEESNANTRDALDRLAERAAMQGVQRSPAELAAESIGETSPPLGSYLEEIAKPLEITIREASERPVQNKNGFVEKSVDVKIYGVTLSQLARFLKQVETRQPGVVTQRIYIKPYIAQREKLDVELTISAFERAKKGAEKGDKGTDKPSAEAGGT